MTDFDTAAQDGNLDLISLAQSGDRDALEQLITQNMGLVKTSRGVSLAEARNMRISSR